MNKRKGDTAITVIIIIVVVLILLVSYFMFFRNTNNDNVNDLNNGTTNNDVNIYNDKDNGNMSSDLVDGINLADANARDFYERVKKGVTLNGKLVEVPEKYITRLTNKISGEGYKLSNDAKKEVNKKYDEIEKTLADNKVSDINDLDDKTKDKIEELIADIEKAL